MNAKRDAAANLSTRIRRFYSFMLANPIGVISSVTPDREPHGVVVYYLPDEKLNLYFLTREGTRLYDNVVHSSYICVTSFNSLNQSTLQACGYCKRLTDPREINSIAGKILEISNTTSLQKLPPVTKLSAGLYAGFKIEPQQLRMASYLPNKEAPHELFESIESFDLNP